MIYPEYAEVDGKKYKINTDFRIAIECDKIARDTSIDNLERGLAIIYMLFGDEGLNDSKNHQKLLDLAQKYLSCGKEINKNKKQEKPDMDFVEDYGYIWASFMSDYNGLDIDKADIHWWKFMDLMNGLSGSELGNCCVLNRVRNLRNMDPRKIKDTKERQKIIDAQKEIALKSNEEKRKPTREQRERADDLYKKLGLRRE